MLKICEKFDSAEIIAIAETRARSFADYQPVRNQEVLIVMDGPKSAGNLGMMIRSAVAFGVNGLVISGRGADEFDPKCIRSSV